jgi:hypothetical protein
MLNELKKIKINKYGQEWGTMPVIPATQEAEVGESKVQGQPEQS